MAVLDTFAHPTSGLSRFGRSFSRALGALADRRDARATRRELNRLSDHELSDIGLIRADIDTIARRIVH